jgi:hypothetical protein
MFAWPLTGMTMNGRRFCFKALIGVAAASIPLAIFAIGCGAGASQAEHAEALPDETVVHEPCEGTGHIATLKVGPKGNPEIQLVTDGSGHERCRIVDLDHDGKPDLYEYFDASGTVRRREYCYDRTGTVNAIEQYQAGKLTKREFDLAGSKRIDTWDWFDPNAPVDAKTGRPEHPIRRERDTRGDGHIDQWWTWNGDKVTIAVDRTGSGKPDPETAIVFSANGPGAAAPSAPGDVGGSPSTTDGGSPATASSASPVGGEGGSP